MLTALSAATCGSISQLMLKLVSISAAHLPSSLLVFSVALAALACAAPVHLRLLNMTLAGASVSLSVPCYQFLMILCATSAGGVLFNEFAHQTKLELQAYALGVLTATVGLATLSRNASSSEISEEEPIEGETSSDGAASADGLSAGEEEAESLRSTPRRSTIAVRRNSVMLGGISGVGIGAAISEAGLMSEMHMEAAGRPSRRLRNRAMTWSGGLHWSAGRRPLELMGTVPLSPSAERSSSLDDDGCSRFSYESPSSRPSARGSIDGSSLDCGGVSLDCNLSSGGSCDACDHLHDHPSSDSLSGSGSAGRNRHRRASAAT